MRIEWMTYQNEVKMRFGSSTVGYELWTNFFSDINKVDAWIARTTISNLAYLNAFRLAPNNCKNL